MSLSWSHEGTHIGAHLNCGCGPKRRRRPMPGGFALNKASWPQPLAKSGQSRACQWAEGRSAGRIRHVLPGEKSPIPGLMAGLVLLSCSMRAAGLAHRKLERTERGSFLGQ